MFFFANLIQSIIQISFLLMVLSPAALAAHTEFQSVFCVTHSTTHIDDIKSSKTSGQHKCR